MAKLPKERFSFTAQNGEKLAFESEVTVNPDGVFHMTMPEELRELAYQIHKNLPKDCSSHHRNTWVGSLPRSAKLWVGAKEKDLCCDFIRIVCTQHLECETTVERVIVYGALFEVSVWKDDEGRYWPNGCQRTGQWVRSSNDKAWPLHAMNRSRFYKVGLAARVCDKTTYTRASGRKVIYEQVCVHQRSDDGADKYLVRLNSFCSLEMDNPREDGLVKEMPYTEAAAKFFYDAMIGLGALADKVSTFLDNREMLMLAIEKSNGLLALPNVQPNREGGNQ